MNDLSFDALVQLLSRDSTRLELAVIALCLVVAGFIARYVLRRQEAGSEAAAAENISPAMRFGREGLQRLIFPLTGIALLAIARWRSACSGTPRH
jgi:hypothetical protein